MSYSNNIAAFLPFYPLCKDDEQQIRAIRSGTITLYNLIDDSLPSSPEKLRAIERLRECLLWAELSIQSQVNPSACLLDTTPLADVDETGNNKRRRFKSPNVLLDEIRRIALDIATGGLVYNRPSDASKKNGGRPHGARAGRVK